MIAGMVFVVENIGYSKHTVWNYIEYIDDEELTHWMPLPSIPESTK